MEYLYINLLISIFLVLVITYLLFKRCVCDNKKETISHISQPLLTNTIDNKAESFNSPTYKLDFLSSIKFNSKCCSNSNHYTSSSGCACLSDSQMKFLNERGGNNNTD